VTRLLVAGESPTRSDEDRERLAGWRAALVELGVTAPGEALEPVHRTTAAGPGRVIVVVREQLDHLNALYCRAVLELTTFTDFASFIISAADSRHHDLAEDLGPLLDASDTELVAVPYSRIPHGPTVPGPLLVAATRLLHKRLTRVALLKPIEPGSVVRAARQVREHAEAHEWDDTTYWGWSADLGDQAIERFRPGNAEFASRAWGTDWPDPPVLHEQTRTDLASCPPSVVSDVLTTIQKAVDGARTGEEPPEGLGKA
jgi:hypothetical protein